MTTTTTTTKNASSATSIVALLMDELRQSLEPKVSHMLADYQLYKETHEAVVQIPFVKALLERQKLCTCHNPNPPAPASNEDQEQIRLEIIDDKSHIDSAPNLDSIVEYINSTVDQNEEEVQDEEEQVQEEEEQEDQEEQVQEEEEQEEQEEQEEEEQEEEEQEEQEEQAEEDQEEEEQEDQEEELELFEVEIKGKTYVTNDETNGDIYEYENDEVGEIVGAFKNGVAKMIKKSKSSQKK